jgi:hypothetical protein
MVIVALLPLAIFPREQVTLPSAKLQLPRVVVVDRWARPAGSVSTTTTPVAVEGPLLTTVRV